MVYLVFEFLNVGNYSYHTVALRKACECTIYEIQLFRIETPESLIYKQRIYLDASGRVLYFIRKSECKGKRCKELFST